MDVKKVGKIHDRAAGAHGDRDGKVNLGYDYIHSLVDDHSRVAYSLALPDEKGATCAAFLRRAAAHLADKGIERIERVMTDNAFAYRHSADMKTVCTDLAAKQRFIKPGFGLPLVTWRHRQLGGGDGFEDVSQVR